MTGDGQWSFSLLFGLNARVWAAIFLSDQPSLLHQRIHRELSKRRPSVLKAGSNTVALRCCLTVFLPHSFGWDAERGKGERGCGSDCSAAHFSSFPCGAGWLADGLVTGKMKMNAEKFACVNFSSPRCNVERSHTQSSSHAHRRHACRLALLG